MNLELKEILDHASLAIDMEHDGYLPSAWYRMKFIEPGTIVFLVQKSVLKWFKDIEVSNFGSANGYEDEFGFKFLGPENELWGYNQTIRTVPCDEHGWIRYEIDLPQDIQAPNFPCTTEEGNNRARAVAASLSQLALVLKGVRPSYVHLHGVPQLLFYSSYIDKREMCGAGLAAFYSRIVAEWAQAQTDNTNLIRMAYAMKAAENHMYPRLGNEETEGPGRFEAWVHHGYYLALDISHQVGLAPEGSKYKRTDIDNGYKVDTHNPDSVTDQLILIAGLARLYEVVEQDFLFNR